MSIKEEIIKLSQEQSKKLAEKMAEREEEMKEDDNSHFLIYKVLGVGEEDGIQIDLYQNKGRFLYKYAGAFLEKAAVLCFQERFPDAKRIKIYNPVGEDPQPKKFEIDCLIEKDAIEIKWRDATTDGNHTQKEVNRVLAIKQNEFKPIRLMFYQPNRDQAIRIQATLKNLYKEIGGEYYSQKSAWDYVKNRTGIDLKAMLIEIADENFPKT
jgi:ApaLI-like restriction endonuclease